MHNASCTYKAKSPKEIAFVDAGDYVGSGVPKDFPHYGIVNADFHEYKYHVRKVVEDTLQEKITDIEESKEVSLDEGATPARYEVAAYDFD